MAKPNRVDNSADKVKVYAESACCLYTIGVSKDIVLNLKLSRRTPNADFKIIIPAGIQYEQNSVFVNVIGRGEVPLTELYKQSAGRFGIGYERIVGYGSIKQNGDNSSCFCMQGLDLRPDNGIDVQIRIQKAVFEKEGTYSFHVLGNGEYSGIRQPYKSYVNLKASPTISDFHREIRVSQVYDKNTDYQAASFRWSKAKDAIQVCLLHSVDYGVTWKPYQLLDPNSVQVQIKNLEPEKEHWFSLEVTGGRFHGRSNIAKVYSGMYNVRTKGNAPVDGRDAGEQINTAIDYMNQIGGGTVLFEGGHFSTTTVYLKSNVYLYIDKTAKIKALRGCNDEEDAWYSNKEYREDMSHMSKGPYLSPDNWMTKQDGGHSYWHNALFFGERLDNIKIIGNGCIDGENNLTKSNTVMEHEKGNRANKMIALKLCTNFELGGLSVGKDLWYEETDNPNEDQPFYLNEEGKDSLWGIQNMLHISNGGHFAVLATGVDGICTHDIYAEKGPQVRDIFDYMSCNDILAFNIYAQGASDDVIKLGSDCSLGFTRPSKNCIIRNIIGDTACNLFQIGSETADDIQDICIDNIYVLASDKAGFSISVNDGGHIRNVHLNCGGSVGECRYGVQHKRLDIGYKPAHKNPHKSKMCHIRTPFFISLSNRGRIIGARAIEKEFIDDIGMIRKELMVTNVEIGAIENVFLRNVDIKDMYGCSQAKSLSKSRWPAYKNQARTTPLIVGYKISDGANLLLPDGTKVKRIENVTLEEIYMTIKGGNPFCDASNTPRELGVGQFNLRNLAEDERGSKIPAYGCYVRHVKGMTIKNCSIKFEENDDRYAVVLDDVQDINIENLITGESVLNKEKIKIIK